FDERELLTAIDLAIHRHRVDRRVRASERFLATTLHSIGDAVVAVDTQGRVTLMNPMAERLCNWPEAESLGRPLSDVLHLRDARGREPLAVPLEQVLRERTIVSLPGALLVRRDGVELPI